MGIGTIVMAASACEPEPPPVPSVSAGPALPPRGEFVARSYPAKTAVMPYRLFIPKDYDPQQRYPLILWLHGAGGSGTDNASQIAGDQVPGTSTWTTPELQAAHPAFVLVPQAASGWAAPITTPDLGPNLAVVVQILDAVTAEFSIDSRRIYALGQSIGGGGAWNLISNEPDRFAAAVILCPVPGNLTRAARVATMPVWIFQGDVDSAALVEGSRALVKALRAAGGKPRYTEYPKVGHDIWTKVFNEPDLVPWLFAQSR